MTLESRKAQASGASGDITATLTGSGADNSFGMIAWVKCASATLRTLTAASTTAGWAQVGSTLTFGTNTLALYKRRGNSSVTAFGVASGSVSVVINVVEYSGVYDDDFVTMAGATLGSAGTTLASGTRTSTEDGMIANAYLTTGTGTATSFAFSNSYNSPLGASGTTFAWSDRAVTTSGTNAATTATWTTSRTAALGVALLRVTAPPPPPNPTHFYLYTVATDTRTPLHPRGVVTP